MTIRINPSSSFSILSGAALMSVHEGGPLPVLVLRALDGSNTQRIEAGAWASLSHDGTRLAYNGANGTRIMDLSTGSQIAFGEEGRHFI